jgi:hypothetical protein
VSVTLSNDYPTVVRCVNKGVLLVDEASRAPVTRDLQAVVAVLAPAAGREVPTPKPSLLKRFFTN